MSGIEDLTDFLRSNLKLVLGVLLLLLALAGDAWVAIDSLLPRWEARTQLQAAQAEAEAAVNQAIESHSALPDQLGGQLDAAQADLASSASIFISAEEANKILDRLFGYADAAGASILLVEALPTPPGESLLYELLVFRIEAQGSSRQLMAFIRNIEETRIPGVIIRNLVMQREENAQDILTMEIHFYISAYSAGGEAMAAQPTPTQPTPGKTAPPAPAATQPGLFTPDQGQVGTPQPPLISTPAASAAPVCDCSANVYDCRDFANQPAAQACYEYCGGVANDIHLLDVDLNGIACQTVLQWSSP